MLAQPVAGPFNLNDHGVVQKSVEQGRCDDWIAEHDVTPQYWNDCHL